MPDKNAAAHRVLNNGKILKILGYNVIYIGINELADKNISESKYEFDGFDIWEIKCKTSSEKMKCLTKTDSLRNVIEYYGSIYAVIAYDYYASGLFNLIFFCKKNNIKLYADTDEWFGWNGNSIKEKLIRGMDSFIRMRILQPSLEGVITISQYLKDYYEKKTNTVCIPPLTDKSEKKWIDKIVNKENRIELVYAGSPGRNKDKLDSIIDVIAEFTDRCYFNVVGITKEEYINAYPEYENKKSMLKNINFTGRLSHNEALQYVKRADFTIFYREQTRVSKAGFPTKFVESISCGTPVITNRTSNINYYLTDGINGFFIGDNVQEDLKKILSMDISELKNIKKNVMDNIFDYHNYIEEMRKLFGG